MRPTDPMTTTREVTWRDVYPPMRLVYASTWQQYTTHAKIRDLKLAEPVNRLAIVFIDRSAWHELFAGVELQIQERIRRWTPSIDRVFCMLKQFQIEHLCAVSVGVHDRLRLRVRWALQMRLNEPIAFVGQQIRRAIQAPVRGEP